MKKLITITGILILLGALGAGIYAVLNNKQIIPNQAAILGGVAKYRLSPGNTNMTEPMDTTLDVDLPAGKSVDGFQVVINFSGTVPADLAFTPQTPAGMQMVVNDLSKTATTATFKLAYITQSPASPYTTSGSTYLGRFKYTKPNSGQMVISFDNTLTKIVEHGTSQDIADIPSGATYIFLASSATTTPTATPTSDVCVRRTQIISLTPATQTGYRGHSLAYTLSVKNDDSSECGASTFSFSAILPYSNWAATFSTFNRVINPGDTSTATVNFISSTNSPFGTLPVGVNVAGPKAAVVAAANYQVLAPTATTKPTAKPTPEVVYVPGTSAKPTATAIPSLMPTSLPFSDQVAKTEPQGVLSNIPTAVLYGIGAFLLIILFFILRALFSGGNKDNNPPKMTPPTTTPIPPTQVPQAPMPQNQTPGTMNPPTISHSVEAPITDQQPS